MVCNNSRDRNSYRVNSHNNGFLDYGNSYDHSAKSGEYSDDYNRDDYNRRNLLNFYQSIKITMKILGGDP